METQKYRPLLILRDQPGWCAHAAIQMALWPFGIQLTQEEIDEKIKCSDQTQDVWPNMRRFVQSLGTIRVVERKKLSLPRLRQWVTEGTVIVNVYDDRDWRLYKRNPVLRGNKHVKEMSKPDSHFMVVSRFGKRDFVRGIFLGDPSNFSHVVLPDQEIFLHSTEGSEAFVPIEDFNRIWSQSEAPVPKATRNWAARFTPLE